MKEYYLRFPSTGKIYQYKSELGLSIHDQVLVESEQIIEEGIIIDKPLGFSQIETSDGNIIRILLEEDLKRKNILKAQAKALIAETQKKAHRHGLDMQILDADLSFDEKKLTFYFISAGRIDFRSLVSDLVKSYQKLIRLQQVGPRDEAKYYGGIGKCGRELCCAKFLKNLESITLEMAENQELATAGSAKLSGCCGKLMCCLAFEAQNYEDIKKKMPKIGSNYSSPSARGKVVGHNILEGKIVLEDGAGKKIEVIV